MKIQSPYQKTLALKRQIKAAESAIDKLRIAADVDRAIRGLKACGRAKVTFDYDHINEACVCGNLIGPIGGYKVSELFDFKDYHAFITCQIDGFGVSIHTDDGTVSIQISFKDRIKQTDVLAAKLKAIYHLLKMCGIKMTAKRLTIKRDNMVKELGEMNALIAAVEA